MKINFLAVLAGVATTLSVATAQAQVVSYMGFDAGASGPGANALASRNAFVASTGASINVDWEGSLPSGFGWAASSSNTQLRSTPSCAISLCGGNTTSGGRNFLDIYGGTATFTFSDGIDYFGGFFGGHQIANTTVTFFDGSQQSVTFGFDGSNGGFSFAGFTDFGKSIASVQINASNDIISADDLMFGKRAAVPEPSTWALAFTGLVALGYSARRRRA